MRSSEMETTESESNVEMERSEPVSMEEEQSTGGSQSESTTEEVPVEETFYRGYINNK